MLKKSLESGNIGLKFKLSNLCFFGKRYLAGEWQPCGAGVVLLFQACFNDGQIIWEEIQPPKFSPKYFR